MKLDGVKREIVKWLRPLNPDKVILFGSYAWGKPSKNSDIDLYIVTKDDFLPHGKHRILQIRKKSLFKSF